MNTAHLSGAEVSEHGAYESRYDLPALVGWVCVGVAMVFCLVGALGGCAKAPPQKVEAEMSANVELFAMARYRTRIDRIADHKNGVVCYTVDGYRAISCVRVRP